MQERLPISPENGRAAILYPTDRSCSLLPAMKERKQRSVRIYRDQSIKVTDGSYRPALWSMPERKLPSAPRRSRFGWLRGGPVRGGGSPRTQLSAERVL